METQLAFGLPPQDNGDLCVKGVELKLVGAFECFCVDLLKSDPVELALKDVDLLIFNLIIACILDVHLF